MKTIIPIAAKAIPPIKKGTLMTELNPAIRATTTPTRARPIPNHLIEIPPQLPADVFCPRSLREASAYSQLQVKR